MTNARPATVYLDTSTALRVLLGHEPRLAIWDKWDRAYASELLGLEARRVVDRLRLESVLDDAGVVAAQEGIAGIEAAVGRVALTVGVARSGHRLHDPDDRHLKAEWRAGTNVRCAWRASSRTRPAADRRVATIEASY